MKVASLLILPRPPYDINVIRKSYWQQFFGALTGSEMDSNEEADYLSDRHSVTFRSADIWNVAQL